MRTILFTGKGGVGKTTIAAATAVAAARSGRRTAVMSTDPAHSLGDALATPIGDEWVRLDERLDARELNARRRLDDQWDEIRQVLTDVFEWAGLDAVEAEELAVVPGLDELFALADMVDVARSGDVDVLIVDCAPTAETLRFLSLPDIVNRAMERAFPVSRRLNRVVGPLVARLADTPVIADEVFDATERFALKLQSVRRLLDATDSSVRLVVTPERMVIAEAKRTFTYLSMYGFNVDAVIANRVLPREAGDGWWRTWVDVQEQHLATLREAFDPPTLLLAPMADRELVGADDLGSLAESVYGSVDPTASLGTARPLRFARNGAAMSVEIDLPFVAGHDIDVQTAADELIVTIDAQRRVIRLPDSLGRRDVASARLAGGTLTVSFSDDTSG